MGREVDEMGREECWGCASEIQRRGAGVRWKGDRETERGGMEKVRGESGIVWTHTIRLLPVYCKNELLDKRTQHS